MSSLASTTRFSKFVLAVALLTLACLGISYGLEQMLPSTQALGYPLTLLKHMSGPTTSAKDIDETFDFRADEVTEIGGETEAIDITVAPSPDADVHVQFAGKVPQEWDKVMDITLSRGVLHFRTLENRPRKAGKYFSYSFQFNVPHEDDFRHRSGVTVLLPKGSKAPLALTSASGDIDITGIKAPKARLETISGDITANKSGFGDVDIHSVSGSIQLASTLKRLYSKTTSGDLAFESSTPFESVDATTISGNIALELSSKQGALVEAKSISGDFNSDWSLTTRRQPGQRSMHGRIPGNSNATIRVETISGDFTLRGVDSE